MAENRHTMNDLYQMQSLPLSAKLRMTEFRIRQWIEEFGRDGVYVSFSGGKDSTVLLDIVRNRMNYPDIPAVFVNVPTQYPELKEFALTWDNVEVINPTMSFLQVCEKYGFPLVSKEISESVHEARSAIRRGKTDILRVRQLNGTAEKFNKEKWKFMLDSPYEISHMCCVMLKKNPIKKYEKESNRKPITATMANESVQRTTQWLVNGCNGFQLKRPISNPMSFWTEQDILLYIKENDLSICSVYGDVVPDWDKTDDVEGQMTISDLEGFNNMELFDAERPPLKTTGCKRTGCMLCGFGCHLNHDDRFLQLKETHPKMYALLDVIKNNGITMREAIEWLKEHGNLDIRL